MLLPNISTKNSKHNSNVAFRKQVSREVNHVLKPPVFTNGCLQESPKYSQIEKSHQSNMRFAKPLSMSVARTSPKKNTAVRELTRNISKGSLDGKASPSLNKSILTMPDKDLHETPDGQLMFEGDI